MNFQQNQMPTQQQYQPYQMNYQQNYGYPMQQQQEPQYNQMPMGMGIPNQMVYQDMNYGYQNYPMNMPPQNMGGGPANSQYYQQNTGYSMPQQNYMGMSDNYNQQFPQQPGFDAGYQGFESMGFYGAPADAPGMGNNSFMPPGDPHPSMFRSNQPPPQVKIKQQSNDQMRAGSWDPKFLQKSGIKKFQHNNGKEYTEGQIANWNNMKKNPAYSKVKKNKRSKKKPQNHQVSDQQNIFSQTFGGPESQEPQQDQFGDLDNPNQLPFYMQDPPNTVKSTNFNQSMGSARKSSEPVAASNQSTFNKGQSFSETFQMQGPLKSSRLPQRDSVVEKRPNELKKSKSNDYDEIMHDIPSINNQQHSQFYGNFGQKFGQDPNVNTQGLKFDVIEEEENKYSYDNFSAFGSHQNNFVSGHIPEVESIDITPEGEGFGMPSHTPSAKSKQPKVGTAEDRNSKGINGLLELAGSQYQMEQIGEEED